MHAKRILTILLLALSITTASHAKECWHAVIDNDKSIPLDNIECLLSTDGEPSFNILLKDGSIITNAEYMTFEMKESSGVSSVVDLPSESGIIVMRNTININNAAGSSVTLLTIDGRTLLNGTIDSNNYKLDISTLSSATYILNVNGKPIKFLKK